MDEEITDLGCRLTGFKCGKNMVFVPVEEFFVSENLDPIIGCIQRCKCKEAFIYSKKDGECKKKVWIFFIAIFEIQSNYRNFIIKI